MIRETVSLSEHPGWIVKPRSRRLAEFSIADSLLIALLQRTDLTWRVDGNPLPDDAAIVGVQYRAISGAWAIYVESETLRPSEDA